MKKRMLLALVVALFTLIVPLLSFAASPADAPAALPADSLDADAAVLDEPLPAPEQPEPIIVAEDATDAEEDDISPAPILPDESPEAMAPYPGGSARVTTYNFDTQTGDLARVCEEELNDAYNYVPLEVGQTLSRDSAGNLVFYVQPAESTEYTLQFAADLNVGMTSVGFDSEIGEIISLNEQDTAYARFCFHLKAGEYYAFRGIGFTSVTISKTPATPLTLDKKQATSPDRTTLYSFTAPAAGRYMTKATPPTGDEFGRADFLDLNNNLMGDSVYLNKGERVLVVPSFADSLTIKQVALYDSAEILTAALVENTWYLEYISCWEDDGTHTLFSTGDTDYVLGAHTHLQKPYFVFEISDTSATPRLLSSNGKEIALKSTISNGTKIYYTPLSVKGSRRELKLLIRPESGGKELQYTIQINPPAYKPGRPTNCHARQSGTAVNLSWAPVSGADFYRIYRRDGKDKNLKHIATIDADQCSYTDLHASQRLSNPKYIIVAGADTYGNIAVGPSGRAFTVPGFRPTPAK